jgi:excisionase family DNA binding protein
MPIKRIESLKDYDGAFITTAQAGDYTATSAKFMRGQIEKGALPARRFGGEWRILTDDFRNYIGTTGTTTK